MAGSFPFGLLSLIITAGGCVLLFMIILAGTRDWDPLNKIYFIWADTSDIPRAPTTAEWTLWNVCNSVVAGAGGRTTDCSSIRAAHPFVPQQNFDTTRNIPEDFLDSRRTYYYLSRFTFAFYLISLFFMLISMVVGLLALCSRLGSALSALASAWALFCITLTAAMMTAVYVMGRNAFNDAGYAAGLGVYAFGFTWGAVGAMLFSTVFYCLGFSAARRNHHRDRALEEKAAPRHSRGGRFPFFRRKSPVESERHFAA